MDNICRFKLRLIIKAGTQCIGCETPVILGLPNGNIRSKQSRHARTVPQQAYGVTKQDSFFHEEYLPIHFGQPRSIPPRTARNTIPRFHCPYIVPRIFRAVKETFYSYAVYKGFPAEVPFPSPARRKPPFLPERGTKSRVNMARGVGIVPVAVYLPEHPPRQPLCPPGDCTAQPVS